VVVEDDRGAVGGDLVLDHVGEDQLAARGIEGRLGVERSAVRSRSG
jgi:hypothetical protein